MAGRRSKKRSLRELVTADIELMPMLNVFITIIPLLLLSAAFVPVSVIKTTLPAGGDGAAAPATTAPLDLSIFIHQDRYVLEVNQIASRTIARPAAGADAARAELGSVLKEIASAHPGKGEVRIVSEPSTRYEEIIVVMDLARAAGLPEASLAEAVVEGS
jgi:biopolymer transport protein ExbD